MVQEGGHNAGRRAGLWLVIVSLMVGYISASALAAQLTTPPCRFAKQYTTEEIVTNSTLRHQFIKDAFFWEGNFPKNGVGLNFATGLTYDGHGLNYSTGEPAPGMLHYWSAASKESLHLILLAHAVVGNELALTFACNDCANSSDQLAFVLTILQNKINSYNQWNARYPGFGGFIPWIYLNDSGAIPADGWENQVPGLDNGEMIWGIQAVYVALDKIGQTNLSNQYKAYFDLLAKNSLTVFYDGYGRVRAVAMIKDTQAAPTPSNYYTSSTCGRSCYLDDPYEGEMMTFFMDLYGDWGSEINQREDLWIYKRKMLRKVEYVLPPNFPKMVEEAQHNHQIPQVQKQALSKMLQQWKEAGSPSSISVQEGFWFSAHEQWKYLELPYLDVPVNQRVFFNGERARTWNSALQGIPGLFASVTDVSAKPNENPDYQSSMGIASIAFQPILVNTTITPYGSFPVWLTGSQGVGAAWYHSMLTGPSMQGPLGSTESGNLTGTAISPVVTWDSKISTLGAILGGIADFTRSALQRDGHYPRFKYIIEREWSRVFPTLNGELLPFAIPVVPIPQTLGDFPTCTTSSNSVVSSSGDGASHA